ncbi:DNA-directed RNA polymerases I, II, and III subunit RPABC3 [Wickerhamiella sorbophila]|uniref:DNA-directed RNA polymerases I, II, and III subunit RPABC3 n=1 Tax=Wickerhamiella sorbophila TaxID=45607 RepID=A0A2T0FJS3_9ASCO|nr:DNA-directed RNA polymerases I, II, and III subunit RPABC3 [Wickerhamiella sorbophila]PRT55236.1 DNA-directed RNA polymerases I, II, and III subunit RPABC3 [Wickerhamiella sorbophila]
MSTLFSDLFRVEQLDSARYDRVARIQAQCTTTADIALTLDINTELFPVQVGETLTVALASSLSLDGEAPASKSWRPPRANESSLADEYQYVMYGTVYKFTEAGGDKLAMYVSFGGLLMCLEGSHRHLSSLKQEHIYLLIRR